MAIPVLWKDVVGFEGLYIVSNLGEIRSVDHYVRCNDGKRLVRGRTLKPCDRGNGYPFVTMGKDGKQYNMSVHRVVAIAFLPNPNNLPEVNHKDANTFNYSLDNLEWCDRKYNVNYGTAQARHSVTASDSFKRTGYYQQILEGFLWKAVAKCGTDGNEIERYKSIKEASEKTGVFQGDISRCCKGIRKTCGGFKWMYI